MEVCAQTEELSVEQLVLLCVCSPLGIKHTKWEEKGKRRCFFTKTHFCISLITALAFLSLSLSPPVLPSSKSEPFAFSPYLGLPFFPSLTFSHTQLKFLFARVSSEPQNKKKTITTRAVLLLPIPYQSSTLRKSQSKELREVSLFE